MSIEKSIAGDPFLALTDGSGHVGPLDAHADLGFDDASGDRVAIQRCDLRVQDEGRSADRVKFRGGDRRCGLGLPVVGVEAGGDLGRAGAAARRCVDAPC